MEHTSEVGFRAYGETLDEAFENAGKAMFSLMADLDEIREDKTIEFDVDSEALDSLLYDFLDQLIYLRDVEGMLFRGFDVEIDRDDFSLQAEATGCLIGDIPAQDVKAVTYSDMQIEETDEGWMLQVVLDV